MPLDEAARICALAAGFLADAFSKDEAFARLRSEAQEAIRPELWRERPRGFPVDRDWANQRLRSYFFALVAVAPYLGPSEVAQVIDVYGSALVHVSRDSQDTLAEALAHLAARLDADAAFPLAHTVSSIGALRYAPWRPSKVTAALADILAGVGPTERKQRAGAVAMATAAFGEPLATVAYLQPALESVRGPLPTNRLVELLKQPGCCGHARRVVLDQLGFQLGRPFADVWAFVRHARAEGIDLDQ